MSASAARNGFLVGDSEDRVIGGLFSSEMWWRDHYRDIGNYGYRLRSRYDPDWQPSWRTSGKDFFTTEDGQPTLLRAGMDATRIRDGRSVMLKKVLPEEGPHELNINRLFSSSEHFRCHDNHCVPLLDVIELSAQFGSQKLMVFPLLRPFNQPQFQTFGEFTAFFTQICEGLRFMHQQNIAHGDCTANNIMFDPSKMYPNGFQPIKNDLNRNFKGAAKAYTRTQRPPRYYFTNFGLSRQYLSRDALDEPLRDKQLVRKEFMEKYNGFEFMEDLVASMTQDNPAERPTIEDVLREFSHIEASLSETKLRSAITSKDAPKVRGIIEQSVRTLRNIVSRQPANPNHF